MATVLVSVTASLPLMFALVFGTTAATGCAGAVVEIGAAETVGSLEEKGVMEGAVPSAVAMEPVARDAIVRASGCCESTVVTFRIIVFVGTTGRVAVAGEGSRAVSAALGGGITCALSVGVAVDAVQPAAETIGPIVLTESIAPDKTAGLVPAATAANAAAVAVVAISVPEGVCEPPKSGGASSTVMPMLVPISGTASPVAGIAAVAAAVVGAVDPGGAVVERALCW